MKSKKSSKAKTSSVTDVIAKSCGLETLECDPTLSDLFSNQKYRAKPEDVTQLKASTNVPKSMTFLAHKKPKGRKVEEEVTLSHVDAASIRVSAKQKSRTAVDNQLVTDVKPELKNTMKIKSKRKNKKNLKGNIEEPLNTSVTEIEDKGNDLGENNVKSEEKETDEVDVEPKVLTIAERNTPKNKNPELEARTVFVGNVPKNCSSKLLRKLFSAHGEIEAIRFRGAAPAKPTQLKKVAIYRNEIHPDRNSLVAFLRYKTREEAENAARSMRGVKVHEHHLTIDLADNKAHDDSKAVFIGNLALKLTDDELWNHFEDCGTIISVRIVRDRESGLGKGIGFVNFTEEAAVELALKKNGSELKGRAMRISKARVNKKSKKTDFSTTIQRRITKKVQKPDARSSEWKSRSKSDKNSDKSNFSGERIAEIGKLKRKSSKPNRGEVKKARIAKQLTGTYDSKKPKKAKAKSVEIN